MEEEILELLLTRNSNKHVVAPAPTDAELEQILACAARAPDHKEIMPWRFIYFRCETGQKLADELQRRAGDALNARQQQRIAKVKGQFSKPLVIAVVAKTMANPDCPQYEQMLAVGAAAMNILNAVHFLGYAAFWSSTLDPVDKLLPTILELQENEQLCGLIAIGSAESEVHKTRAFVSQYSREIRR